MTIWLKGRIRDDLTEVGGDAPRAIRPRSGDSDDDRMSRTANLPGSAIFDTLRVRVSARLGRHSA